MGSGKRQRRISFAVGVCLALLAGGCRHYLRTVPGYAGGTPPEDEVGRVFLPPPVMLRSLDGVPNQSRGLRYTVLELTPGTHVFEAIHKGPVSWSPNQTTWKEWGPFEHRVEVEPGKVYFVVSHEKNERVFQGIAGPFPRTVEIAGTDRRVSIARDPASPPGDVTDNLCILVEKDGKVVAHDAFLVPDQLPVYSEGEDHVAFWIYHGREDRQWFVDGVPERLRYELFRGPLRFSDDGERYAYAGERGGKLYLVVDGYEKRIGNREHEIVGLTFAPRGEHLAYLKISPGGTSRVVVDDRARGPFEDAFAPIFTEKRGRLVFFAEHDGRWHLHVDRVTSPVWSEERPLGVIFYDEPERRFAWIARDGDGRFAVVADGRRDPAYDEVSSPLFTDDGEHLVYAGWDADAERAKIHVNGEIRHEAVEVRLDSLGFDEAQAELFFEEKRGSRWVTRSIPLRAASAPEAGEAEADEAASAPEAGEAEADEAATPRPGEDGD